jgi:hypothetical protein
MTQTTAIQKHTGKRILRTTFYIFSAIVLLAGLFLFYAFALNAPQAIRSTTTFLQSPAFNVFFNQLDSLLRTIGAILLVINLLLSVALFGLGRMISQNIHLLERVEALEVGARVETLPQ